MSTYYCAVPIYAVVHEADTTLGKAIVKVELTGAKTQEIFNTQQQLHLFTDEKKAEAACRTKMATLHIDEATDEPSTNQTLLNIYGKAAVKKKKSLVCMVYQVEVPSLLTATQSNDGSFSVNKNDTELLQARVPEIVEFSTERTARNLVNHYAKTKKTLFGLPLNLLIQEAPTAVIAVLATLMAFPLLMTILVGATVGIIVCSIGFGILTCMGISSVIGAIDKDKYVSMLQATEVEKAAMVVHAALGPVAAVPVPNEHLGSFGSPLPQASSTTTHNKVTATQVTLF